MVSIKFNHLMVLLKTPHHLSILFHLVILIALLIVMEVLVVIQLEVVVLIEFVNVALAHIALGREVLIIQ